MQSLSLFPADNLTAGREDLSLRDVGSFEVKELLPVACEGARKPERSKGDGRLIRGCQLRFARYPGVWPSGGCAPGGKSRLSADK